MVKPSASEKKKDQTVNSKKRQVSAKDEENDQAADENLMVEGLIDIEADDSDDSDEEFQDASEFHMMKDTNGSDADKDDDDEEDSDDEYNKLLAAEEGEGEGEGEGEDGSSSDSYFDSFSSDAESQDSHSIVDKLSNVKLNVIEEPLVEKTEFCDGTLRLIRPEIDPKYDSDDTDAEQPLNTIGDIPLSAYDEMPHIGYDINGKRIMRPAKGSALDELLESIELPEGWTGLLDKNTGKSLNLTTEELELIKKIERNEKTDDSMEEYPDYVDWFSRNLEVMPLTAIPEPKRRFVPSKHEAKRVMKIVRAIREGRIIPPNKMKELREEEAKNFDLWGDNDTTENDHVMNLRAPKLPPPTNEESYNPPSEYLMTKEEIAQWEALEPSERTSNFIPKQYGALRKVPGYTESVRERFERSLDLYLAPRVRKNKLQIDPESLIPDLPSPKDLKPFPIKCSTIYKGHTDKIRTLSIDPSGLWLATGSDDGTVRVWEILTGREVYKMVVFDKEDDSIEDKIENVSWNPDKSQMNGILAITFGETIYLIVPPIFGFEIENQSKLKIENGFGFATFGQNNKGDLNVNDEAEDNLDDDSDDEDSNTKKRSVKKNKDVAQWNKPTKKQQDKDISIVITCEKRKPIKQFQWHRKGDYFVTVQQDAGNTSILIHQLSKHLTQSPFKKNKGIIMDCKFHPFKPQLIVCSQRLIRIYDLSQQILIKKLLPGARWLSKIDIHPRGDNLIASSFDKRVLYHDLDLSSTPYKTLRYHDKAVRDVRFHNKLPLFCTAADDGSIHIFHNTVYDDDMMKNPLIVPLKKLTGHKVINSLGVLQVTWHPREAWLFSSGADHTARLWTT